MKQTLFFILFLLCGLTASAQPDILRLGGVKTSVVDSSWVKTNGSYSGKRVADNLYKWGTVGIRTADTTGVLNFGNRIGERSAIYTQNTLSSGFRVYNRVQNPATQWQSLPDWDWYDGVISSGNNANTFPGLVDPKPNVVWRRGLYYNKGTATMYESDESNWWANSILGEPGAPFNYFEKHWQVIDSGGYEHRPITGFFQKRANGKGSIGLNVDLVYIDDWYARQNAFFEVNHNSEPRRANTNLFNDSLYLVDYSNLYPTMAAWFASSNKYSGVSTGKGTFIGIGGNGFNPNFAGIGAVYTNDNISNGDLDMVFTTSVAAQQTEQVRIKGGSRQVGLFTPLPQQSLDVNGTALFRGAVRINSVADSASLVLKMASGQTAPAVRIQANNGADIAEVRVANPTTSPSLIVGSAGVVAANCPTNTVLGITSAPLTTAGGGNNVLVGFNTGQSTFNGYQNVHVGSFAGQNTTDGYQNTLIGHRAGFSMTTGYQNMFLGREAGLNNTTGQSNVGLGANTLKQIGAGSANVAIGNQAGDQNVNGNSNVFIGNSSGRTNQGSDNVFIGTSSGELATSVSGQLWVDVTNTTTPLLKGNFNVDTLRVFGRFSAGRENQAATASVVDLVTSSGRSQTFRSNATPESAITANPGDVAFTNASGTGALYGKYTGTSNTGWGKFLNLVDPLSATTGQILTWNGSAWAPATAAITGIGTFQTSGNSNGLSIASNQLRAHVVTQTTPGALSTGNDVKGGTLTNVATDSYNFAARNAGTGLFGYALQKSNGTIIGELTADETASGNVMLNLGGQQQGGGLDNFVTMDGDTKTVEIFKGLTGTFKTASLEQRRYVNINTAGPLDAAFSIQFINLGTSGTMTIPTTFPDGAVLKLWNLSTAGGVTVTIAAGSGETIRGGSFDFTATDQKAELQKVGTEWVRWQ